MIEGNAAADNILRRASGTRDSLSGKKGVEMLKGEGGWTEIAGCPVFTNDDGPKGVQAMSDILTANPKLDAFVIEGGWPLFGAPQPYRQLTDQFKSQIADKSLVIVAADTIGDEVAMAKEGRVEALVGQRPFEMGYKAPTVMIDLISGKKVEDPVFTGLDECTRRLRTPAFSGELRSVLVEVGKGRRERVSPFGSAAVGSASPGADCMRRYRIAVIPGDGIGKEVIPAGVEVLEALAEREAASHGPSTASTGGRTIIARPA